MVKLRKTFKLITTAALALLGFVVAGCQSDLGHIQGLVVENGQPVKVDGQAALLLYRINDSGKPNEAQSYPIPLSADGTFELVASGGAVPPGTYMVTLMAMGMEQGIGRYKDDFAYPDSPLRIEVEAGSNEVTIDLAQPQP